MRKIVRKRKSQKHVYLDMPWNFRRGDYVMNDENLVIEYLDLNNPPEFTPEELKMLDELDKYPIVYDEDCPRLTPEQLARFRRVNPRPIQKNAAQ